MTRVDEATDADPVSGHVDSGVESERASSGDIVEASGSVQKSPVIYGETGPRTVGW